MSRRVVEQHADWLGLLEPDGAFLTAPVLAEAFPTGLERAPSAIREAVKERFTDAPKDAPAGRRRIEWLLREVLGFGSRLVVDTAVPDGLATVGQRGVVLRADAALIEPRDGQAPAVRMAVMFVSPDVALEAPSDDPRWSASPAERLAHLLRAADVPLGLVSDGRRLALVWAPRDGASGRGTWETELLVEERVLLDGLLTVLHARRFFASGPERTPERLMRESTSRQSEVTKELGQQVRQAVELLVGTLARADHHQGGRLLPDDGQEVYDAAVTVMMRLVFCLYAEERRLLPSGDPAYEESYAVGTLLDQLDEEARAFGPELLEHRTTGWHRLLATFRAIHGGVAHEDLLIPAYGGGLFNPDRYPFLEGRTGGTAWHETPARPLPVDDRTVLEMLRALQELRIGGETRRLSFRTLDVEQIGHVYEGLLDHSAQRANEVHLGFAGKLEPEIALTEVESEHTSNDALIAHLRDLTDATANQLNAGLVSRLDADDERLLLLACEDDGQLAARVRPYVGLLRRDLRGLPIVIPTGAMMVTQTTVRRESGTQYTTRELADEIAINALEPLVFDGPAEGLPREEWELRSANDILALKVCDPAVGSGAIIVAALRYLSDRLLEAWDQEGIHDELAVEDRLNVARREVAERCLYGVDRDPLALEMAKLSLWLSTMSRDRPFTFLDHSFKSGDSLLGITSIEQLRNLHLNPDRGRQIMGLRAWARAAPDIVDPQIGRALELIERLTATKTTDVRVADEKAQLEGRIQRELEELHLLGDLVVGAAMVGSFRRTSDYETALLSATQTVTAAPAGREVAAIRLAVSTSNQLLQSGLPPRAPARVPLHWPLAFPEVFISEARSGFDAVVGNPPFRGGQLLTDSLGTTYREYLVGHLADGRAGSADLVAYFFLRANQITGSGQVGFIATNSIAQGQTKKVGLDELVAAGVTIRRAVKERPWPGAAGVHVSQVWLATTGWNGEVVLDGRVVGSITSGLTDAGRAHSTAASKLAANKGLMFQGPRPIGDGFVNLTPPVARRLLSDSEVDYKKVIRPFLGAADVCDRVDQSPSRWCVDFGFRTLEEAAAFPKALDHVEEHVRPERNESSDPALRKYWWRFGRPRRALREAITGLDRVIVIPRHAERYLTVWQPSYVLAGDATNVLASDDQYVMGVMTARVHEIWVRSRPSSLGRTLRYAPSDMFETFPFPPEPAPEQRAEVAGISSRLHRRRRAICEEMALGLTELYNGADRGDVPELVRLHDELDRVVAVAYGWPSEVVDDDDAILHRLVDLNQAIIKGTQTYAPGIRPEDVPSDDPEIGENLRMRA